ncbi:unnamed protein product [Ceratitis capitata]|uniref:Decapping nuclease n=2 Tax=Ceratitis capitata TaxID=7213 RepID=W8C5U9_CERCA|nr:unnamed protein product [Ceratitis capitata]
MAFHHHTGNRANNIDNGYKNLMNLRPYDLLNEKNSPAFYLSRPKIRAIYTIFNSVDITDDVHIKYFHEPKVQSHPLDLNEGFEKFIFRTNYTSMQLLSKVQKYVIEAKENVLQPNIGLNTKTSSVKEQSKQNIKRKVILCQRGVLSSIMIIPYRLKASNYNNTIFYATKYCGILHMSDTSWVDKRSKNDTYHLKFMQCCFSDDPDLEPNTNEPVDQNNTEYSVFHTLLKEYDLIYSGETGGIISEHKIDDVHDLNEVNKCRFIMTKLLWSRQRGEDVLNHPKCLHWWLQAYLGNVSDICIGLKDNDGVVRSPVQVRACKDLAINRGWKPHICVRFLYNVIKLVEETMDHVNCPYTTYEFMYDSFQRCIKFKIHLGKTEHSFLNEEYIKHCKERTSFEKE